MLPTPSLTYSTPGTGTPTSATRKPAAHIRFIFSQAKFVMFLLPRAKGLVSLLSNNINAEDSQCQDRWLLPLLEGSVQETLFTRKAAKMNTDILEHYYAGLQGPEYFLLLQFFFLTVSKNFITITKTLQNLYALITW